MKGFLRTRSPLLLLCASYAAPALAQGEPPSDTPQPADVRPEAPGATGAGLTPDTRDRDDAGAVGQTDSATAEPPAAAPMEPDTPPVSDDGATTDADALAAEERAIAAELAAMQGETPPPATPDTPDSVASARALDGGNALNPAITATGLVLGGGATEGPRYDGDLETGLHLQEVEVRLGAAVDPYFRADLTLAAHEEELHFEEAFLSTLEIPQVTLRAGQMYAAFGRHNALHAHAYPFVTAPLPWRALLGEEGLNGAGISADLLLPLPFFVELNAQAFDGEWSPFEGGIEDDPTTPVDETEPDRRRAGDLAYVGRLRALFELGDDTTVELGGSYVGGRNGYGGRTDVAGGDLTLKWRPAAAGRYTSFEWTSEYLWVRAARAPVGARGGAYSGFRYQFDQRIWAQARGAVLGVPREGPRVYRGEVLLAFIPSEFSGLRLQYAYETAEDAAIPNVHEVFLQAIFSIGPHPPHDY